MASPELQHDLLLGHLALELNFISTDTLSAAKQAWTSQKGKSLGQILVDRQAISPHTLGVLENLVQLQLAQDASEEGDHPEAAKEPTNQAEKTIMAPSPDLRIGIEPAAIEPPREIPARFRKVNAHAAGALGQVYIARDLELRRKVALKEIKDPYADNPDARSRFLLEAEITGRLEHPGVVPVYGMGTYANGRPFYAMRFIKGQSLADAIKELHAPSLSPAERARELRKLLTRFVAVCITMQYAHDRDIVHRDIKPSNIMLGTYGETLVVDWGLAKVMGKVAAADPGGSTFEPIVGTGSSSATMPGRAVGTLTYMSPEQASGRGEDVGPVSDVYSLGATLFSVLTGRTSVEDSKSPDQARVDLRKLQRKVIEGRIQRPRDLKPDVDRALEAVCLKAMALSPQDRYSCARELGDDLERWLANEPVNAWPEPLTVRTRRWVNRHRTMVTGAAAAVLVGLVFSILFNVYVNDEKNRLSDYIAQIEAANKGRDVAEKEKERAVADMDKARGAAKVQEAKAELARRNAEEQQAKAAEQQALAEKASEQVKTQQRLVEVAKKEAAAQEAAAITATKLAAEQQKLADQARTFLELAQKDAKKARDDAARTFAVNNTMLAQNRWNEGQVILANEMLENVEPQFRLAGWQYLRRQFEGSYATLYGHLAPVRYVAFSPDGRLIASATSSLGSDEKKDAKAVNKGGVLKVWDARTGRILQTLDGVSVFAFSPDGLRIASSGSDGTIKLWNAAQGMLLKTSEKLFKGEITSLAFSPDGKRIVSASETGEMKWCDAGTLADPVAFENVHKQKIISLSFSPDGKSLASSSSDKTVLVWNTDKLADPLSFIASTNGIAGAFFSPSGNQLVAGIDETAKVLNLGTGEPSWPFKGRHANIITNVIYSPDGQNMASASFDGTIKIWDRYGNEMQTLQGHTKAVMSIAFSPDSQRLVSASSDWTVKLWDLATGQELQPFTGSIATVSSMSFCPDDKQRLAAGAWNGVVHIWNGLEGKASLSIKAHTKEVLGVAFSADGTRVVSGGHDGNVKLWDAATGKEIPIAIKGHVGGVTSVAFSRDGKQIASAGKDKSVRVWDAQTGAEVWSLSPDAKGEDNVITSVAFSPDGKRLAWADRAGALKVLDVAGKKEIFAKLEHSSGITSVVFAPADDFLASAGQDGRVILWDPKGDLVLSLKGHAGGVMNLAFSLDGKRLASASKDGTVRLWDARTGQAIKTFLGHGDLVTSVAFSPDGKFLVSASLDKTIKLWDATTAKASPIFKGQHARPVESVAWSADGKRIFSRDRTEKLVAWNAESGTPLPDVKEPEPNAVSAAISPDGKKLALPVSNWFHVVDLDITADESAYRANMSRLRANWHRERAIFYENRRQIPWYGAAFHWSLVVQANPADADARQHFEAALKNLSPAEAARLQRQAAATMK